MVSYGSGERTARRHFLAVLLGSTALLPLAALRAEACGGSGIPATVAAVALAVGVPPSVLRVQFISGMTAFGGAIGAIAGLAMAPALATAATIAVPVVVCLP